MQYEYISALTADIRAIQYTIRIYKSDQMNWIKYSCLTPDNKQHNIYEHAFVTFYPTTDKICSESRFINGKKHNLTGPSM
jgi:hypothetical protein